MPYRTEVGYTVSNVSRFLKQHSLNNSYQTNNYENERPLGYFENGWNWIDTANLILFRAKNELSETKSVSASDCDDKR